MGGEGGVTCAVTGRRRDSEGEQYEGIETARGTKRNIWEE